MGKIPNHTIYILTIFKYLFDYTNCKVKNKIVHTIVTESNYIVL